MDVAEAAGFSRSRIGQIEELTAVSPEWAGRYRQAIAVAARMGRDTVSQEKTVSDLTSETVEEARHAPPKPRK